MWFNVAIILETSQEIPEEQQTYEVTMNLADSLLAPYDTHNDEEGGQFDLTEGYSYGPLHCFDPQYAHAVLTPDGLWLAPDSQSEDVWQSYVQEVFTKFSTRYTIWVRCHI